MTVIPYFECRDKRTTLIVDDEAHIGLASV